MDLLASVLEKAGEQFTLMGHTLFSEPTILPYVEVTEFPQMGHIGPVTHPDAVNEAISKFLLKVFS